MAVRRVDIVGSALPILGSTGADEEVSDFRAVPESDRGNEDYDDRGMLGSYRSSSQAFRDPSDVVHFTGYGATEEDIDRGYCVPSIRQDPAYDMHNYDMRSTEPKRSMVANGNTDVLPDDWEFRRRNQRAKGFLTRPRIPTER